MSLHRILIVDDESASRDGLVELLAAWGYQCRPAADGPEALKISRDFSPTS